MVHVCPQTYADCRQATLLKNGTLILIILASDKTHFSQFSGNKKLWPVYMTVGNISSDVHNKPTSQAWIPIAFLSKEPVRVERHATMSTYAQGMEAQQLYHDIMHGIPIPLTDGECPHGVKLFCLDKKVCL